MGEKKNPLVLENLSNTLGSMEERIKSSNLRINVEKKTIKN